MMQIKNKIILTVEEKNIEKIEKILKSLGIETEVEFGWASDVSETEEGINFKLNYKGSSVPFWARGKLENVLAGISTGIQSGMNIIEISEKLKSLV